MTRRRRILVAEDDRAIAAGLRELLGSEGYEVKITGDGVSAMRQSVRFKPDVALLDVNLPGMSGFELSRQLRVSGFLRPILLLTARREQVDKVTGLEAGADDYITKPFDPRELLARIRAQLRAADRMPKPRTAGRAAPRRRLLSVMFTDMQGFARAMNRDEDRALMLLAHHNNLITKAVRQSGGHIVDVAGDAFFVAFESALKAVACGLTILQQLKKYNARRARENQIHIRAGIHLGDVLETRGRLRGDTVNLAARLQQTATPDHILISESVYEAIKRRLRLKVTSLGRRRVRNIAQPVTVYRLTV